MVHISLLFNQDETKNEEFRCVNVTRASALRHGCLVRVSTKTERSANVTSGPTRSKCQMSKCQPALELDLKIQKEG